MPVIMRVSLPRFQNGLPAARLGRPRRPARPGSAAQSSVELGPGLSRRRRVRRPGAARAPVRLRRRPRRARSSPSQRGQPGAEVGQQLAPLVVRRTGRRPQPRRLRAASARRPRGLDASAAPRPGRARAVRGRLATRRTAVAGPARRGRRGPSAAGIGAVHRRGRRGRRRRQRPARPAAAASIERRIAGMRHGRACPSRRPARPAGSPGAARRPRSTTRASTATQAVNRHSTPNRSEVATIALLQRRRSAGRLA